MLDLQIFFQTTFEVYFIMILALINLSSSRSLWLRSIVYRLFIRKLCGQANHNIYLSILFRKFSRLLMPLENLAETSGVPQINH